MAILGLPWVGSLKTYALIQDFGPTNFTAEPSYRGYAHYHTGLDFGLPQGTPLIAPADGTVVATGPQPQNSRFYTWGFGDNALIIQHAGGIYTLYGHMSALQVSQGQSVVKGQPLGLSGGAQEGAGNSTGPHLHFETHQNWYNPVSPWPLIGDNGVASLASSYTGAAYSGTLDYKTVIVLARMAGIPEDQLATAASIAMAESHLRINATNVNSNGSTDYGLWQINSVHIPPYNAQQLESDPLYNARAMAAISSQGRDWTPWTTYKTGAYLTYLPAAKSALASTPPGTSLSLPTGGVLPDSSQSDIQIPSDANFPQLPVDRLDIAPVTVPSQSLAPVANAEATALLMFNEGMLPVQKMTVKRTTYTAPGTLTASTDVGYLLADETSALLNALCDFGPTQTTALMGYVPETGDYFTPDMLTPVFTGLLDAPEFDHSGPDDNLDLSATDMSIIFSDPSATPHNLDSYMNMSSDKVVEKIVKARNKKGTNGLRVQAAKTDTKAGEVYGTDTITSLDTAQTEWDVITSLAETEGWVAFFQGTTLYFGPLPEKNDPLILDFGTNEDGTPVSNVSEVQIKPQRHSKRDYKIIVSSYQHKTGETIQEEAGNKDSQNVMTFPMHKNTPKSTLKKRAKSLLQQYSATEILVTVTIEGLIRLEQGRPIAINSNRIAPRFRYPYATFYPVEIQYDYAQGEGFTMTITATSRPWGIQSTDTAQYQIFG